MRIQTQKKQDQVIINGLVHLLLIIRWDYLGMSSLIYEKKLCF